MGDARGHDAVFYVLRGGIAWSLLPREFPPKSTVYRWFAKFRDSGLFETINHALVMTDRERVGREASPSAGVIDSQSVKTTESGGPRGYDAGKKIKGRKRHALVDTDGRGLVLEPHPANIQDRDGGGPLLQASRPRYPFIKCVVVIITATLTLMTPGAVASQEERIQEGLNEVSAISDHSVYVIFYRPGSAWKDCKSMSRQGLRPHGVYLKRLLEEGKLMAAGPLPEMNGGLVLTRVDPRDEAMAIVEADPAVKAGVFVAEVYSWVIRFTDGSVSSER